jgi:nucleoid-associated protein Lsr2
MAQRVITELVDDLDGTALAEGKGETVAFSIDGLE